MGGVVFEGKGKEWQGLTSENWVDIREECEEYTPSAPSPSNAQKTRSQQI